MAVTRSSLNDVFGISNIDKWADLQNNADPDYIDGRVTWAINLATQFVKAQMKTLIYDWADVSSDPLVEHAIAIKAGLLLYGNRSFGETGKDGKPGSPIAEFKRMYDDFFKGLSSGELSLGTDDIDEQCRPFPGVIKDGIDVSTLGLD